jgi:tetratricopeptide (TPR) repeat protein
MDEELGLYNKAGDLYLKLGDVNAAVEMYERAANRYADSGFANNAIALCNKILRNAPGRTHVYLILAQLLAQRGFVAQAKQNFVEYAERMSRAGKMNEAFSALKRFADMSPDNEEIRLMLAEQLKAAARDDEAKEQLAKLYSRPKVAEDGDSATNKAKAGRRPRSNELVFIDLEDEPSAPTEPPTAQAVEEPPTEKPAVEEAEPEPEVARLEIQTTETDDETVVLETDEEEQEESADFRLEIEHTAQSDDSDVSMLEGLASSTDSFDMDTDDESSDVDTGGLTLEPTAALDTDETSSDLEPAPSDEIPAFELPEEPVSSDEIPAFELPEEPVSSEGIPGLEVPEEPLSTEDIPGLEFPKEPVSTEDIPGLEFPEEPVSTEDIPGLEFPEEPVSSDEIPSIELPEEPVSSDGLDFEISEEPITAIEDTEDAGDELLVLEVSRDALEPEVDSEAPVSSTDLPDLEVPDLDLHGFDDVAPESDVQFITQDETSEVEEETDETSEVEEETPEIGIELGEPELLEIIRSEPEALPSVEELEELVLEDPNDPARRRTYAEALVESGERERGLEELDSALSGFESLDDWAHAHAVATEILRLDPNSVNHHQKRVEYAVRMGERSQMVEAYLELAHALFRSGGLDRARIVYERVLEHDPQNLSAREALATIAPDEDIPETFEREAEPVTGARDVPPQSDFVDLGEFILGDESEKDTRMRVRKEVRTGDEKRDFDEMLTQFKRGIEANIDEEDAQAHYDLGVAFKEMGLLDEAISEFQKALRSPDARLQAAEALGTCFFDKDQYEVAATVLRRAVDTDPGGDEEKIGLLYRLGRCEEAQSRSAEALNWYQRVFAVDINFRDVTDRVNSLAKAGR